MSGVAAASALSCSVVHCDFRSASVAASELRAFCTAVRNLCAIDLTQYKPRQMERRVRTFAERLGIARLDEYACMLGDAPDELEAFLDRMTINVSQLWRNPEQWALLQHTILPTFSGRPRFNAWSAGCSYGAEAYTLAAVCRLAAPAAHSSILGTGCWSSPTTARTPPLSEPVEPVRLSSWVQADQKPQRRTSHSPT